MATSEASDQLAVDRMECPNCGAPLVRDVEGHAHRAWSVGGEPGG